MDGAQDIDRWIISDHHADKQRLVAAARETHHIDQRLVGDSRGDVLVVAAARETHDIDQRLVPEYGNDLPVVSITRETHDIDQRLIGDYRADPWIIAAAHAGDTRAMLFIADRVSYRPVAPGDGVAWDAAAATTRRERAHWYRQAAEHGSAEAGGRLASQADHQRWHARRGYVDNKIVPGPEDLERCQAGADRGDPDCAQVLADHLRGLEPGDQSETGPSQRQAQEEKGDVSLSDLVDQILDEIDEVLEENVEEFVRSYVQKGGWGPIAEIVITAVTTAGLVPFIQAMISKAGADSYDALRESLRKLFTRSVPEECVPHAEDQLLIIEPPGRYDAVLQIWTDLPDEAIAALPQLLYDMRTSHPRRPVDDDGRRWYWNGAARRWEVLTAIGHTSREPASTGARRRWYWRRWDVTAHRWQFVHVSRPAEEPAEPGNSEPDGT